MRAILSRFKRHEVPEAPTKAVDPYIGAMRLWERIRGDDA